MWTCYRYISMLFSSQRAKVLQFGFLGQWEISLFPAIPYNCEHAFIGHAPIRSHDIISGIPAIIWQAHHIVAYKMNVVTKALHQIYRIVLLANSYLVILLWSSSVLLNKVLYWSSISRPNNGVMMYLSACMIITYKYQAFVLSFAFHLLCFWSYEVIL